MNFMGCHFCSEELVIIMMLIPGLSMLRTWLRGKYAQLTGKKLKDRKPKHGCPIHSCTEKKDADPPPTDDQRRAKRD